MGVHTFYTPSCFFFNSVPRKSCQRVSGNFSSHWFLCKSESSFTLITPLKALSTRLRHFQLSLALYFNSIHQVKTLPTRLRHFQLSLTVSYSSCVQIITFQFASQVCSVKFVLISYYVFSSPTRKRTEFRAVSGSPCLLVTQSRSAGYNCFPSS